MSFIVELQSLRYLDKLKTSCTALLFKAIIPTNPPNFLISILAPHRRIFNHHAFCCFAATRWFFLSSKACTQFYLIRKSFVSVLGFNPLPSYNAADDGDGGRLAFSDFPLQQIKPKVTKSPAARMWRCWGVFLPFFTSLSRATWGDQRGNRTSWKTHKHARCCLGCPLHTHTHILTRQAYTWRRYAARKSIPPLSGVVFDVRGSRCRVSPVEWRFLPSLADRVPEKTRAEKI